MVDLIKEVTLQEEEGKRFMRRGGLSARITDTWNRLQKVKPFNTGPVFQVNSKGKRLDSNSNLKKLKFFFLL